MKVKTLFKVKQSQNLKSLNLKQIRYLDVIREIKYIQGKAIKKTMKKFQTLAILFKKK